MTVSKNKVWVSPSGKTLDDLIAQDSREVSLATMSDEALYQLELEKLFGMGWNLLGHESEITAPNDYMVRPMGEDLVIVQRDRAGEIHVTLNVCSHRGMRVALGEYGNTAVHKCIYHGWAFRPNGDFIGAPVDKEKMHGEMCSKAELGLERPVFISTGGSSSPPGILLAPRSRNILAMPSFTLTCCGIAPTADWKCSGPRKKSP